MKINSKIVIVKNGNIFDQTAPVHTGHFAARAAARGRTLLFLKTFRRTRRKILSVLRPQHLEMGRKLV